MNRTDRSGSDPAAGGDRAAGNKFLLQRLTALLRLKRSYLAQAEGCTHINGDLTIVVTYNSQSCFEWICLPI